MKWAMAEMKERDKQIAHLWNHRKPFWTRVSEALEEQLGNTTAKTLIKLGPLEYLEYIHTKFGSLSCHSWDHAQIDQHGRFFDHGRLICADSEPGIQARLLTPEELAECPFN